jgi:hypothetical protein
MATRTGEAAVTGRGDDGDGRRDRRVGGGWDMRGACGGRDRSWRRRPGWGFGRRWPRQEPTVVVTGMEAGGGGSGSVTVRKGLGVGTLRPSLMPC